MSGARLERFRGQAVLSRSANVGSKRQRTIDLAILIAGSVLLFLVATGARDLWAPNEPLYGRAVVEMEARGDWAVPTFNEKVFAEKPILYYWFALAASKALGGVNELSLRLPSGLAAVATVVLSYLLILPYAGRRVALLSAALVATQVEIFWSSRWIQMDVLVTATTLGVIVPLTRAFDFGWRPRLALSLAGFAAGLGFLAKGPVGILVPAMVVVGYLAAGRHLPPLRLSDAALGLLVALAIGTPWFLYLWSSGHTDFLVELLFRQNFSRFVDAWDHQRPWWYYLETILVQHAPWSWILPAALFLPPPSDRERRLRRLSWTWIALVIVFFSLSQSKRGPYILSIAPAVAALSACVLDRLIRREPLPRGARVSTSVAFWAFGSLLVIAGVAVLFPGLEKPPELNHLVPWVALILGAAGVAILLGAAQLSRQPAWAPIATLCGVGAVYLLVIFLVLPASNSLKSARDFSGKLNRVQETLQATVVSFRLSRVRGGYTYYSNRSIGDLESDDQLRSFWESGAVPLILVENGHEEELQKILPEAVQIETTQIGSRTVSLYSRSPGLH